MLLPCVILSLSSSIFASHVDSWPFKLAEKYVEEFKSNMNTLENAASSYQQFNEEFFTHVPQSNFTHAHEHAIHYDFIVVGGGTSGSILASRLSEIPEWKVLLLETGEPENVATRVPHQWETLKNTPYNYAFQTTPQNYSCLAMLDHKCTIPSGRILGGSSSINSMVYTRGNPRDYDLWADLGNKGWCFSDVLPFFKKIEDAHFIPFDKKFHHRGGKQHVQHPQFVTPLTDHVLHAGKELGIHSVDYNGKHQMGTAVPQLVTDCGRRQSTADAYLEPAAKRDNLIVKPLSQVLKVLVSVHTKEAQGVQYLHDGKIFVAKADKEVILAAGAINTPKLLILSGIGPKEQCDQFHIENVVDLKVGHNLKVRPSFIGLDLIQQEPKLEHFDEYNNIIQYLRDGIGPLTSPGVAALAYLATETSPHEPSHYPDIELQFISKPHTKIEDYKWMRMSPKHYESIWTPLEDKASIKIVVNVNHPVSTGILKLFTENPLHQPLIEPHLLSDEDETDYHIMLAGIQHALKFVHTESFHKLGVILNHNPVHGCEDRKFGSDDYWACAVKYLVVPTGDVSGTTRMGPETDSDAIVDNKLKVHGIHKLRVADAGVIPVPITGNLMAASMMIGEKAADLIIEDWTQH